MESLAKIIAINSLMHLRGLQADRYFNREMAYYYEGKIRTAETLFPCIETTSSSNEAIFLVNEYYPRHRS